MRVLVTGASGYVGTAVTLEMLDRGIEICGVSRTVPTLPPNNVVEHVQLDLRDCAEVSNSLSQLKPDVLVHLATSFTSGVDVAQALEHDSLMWRNAVQAIPSVRRVVITSTELVNDKRHTQFQKAYVRSKRRLEAAALRFFQRTNVPVSICRFPHLAGATEYVRDRRPDRILNRLLTSVLDGMHGDVEMYVPYWTQLRYMHVQNAAEMVADRVLTAGGFAIEQCGAEATTIDLSELVQIVSKVAGSPPRVRWRHGSPTGVDGEPTWRLTKIERIVRDTYAVMASDRGELT
ncbi:MAG: NAD(P)-dependent oxidoreductase [Kutzneria sp.]|nr:NAD(P)-dependent oxidoreductase [Kutzneria sp.]